MIRCDVLIIGGGPGGSTCAWKLHQAGLDVVVVDKAVFPRDKVCAGWITPQAVTALQLDLAEYSQRHTLQPITGFRAGIVDGARHVTATYAAPVSYGIRRCEFDHHLLVRSKARLCLGQPVTTIRRDGAEWVVNDRLRAPMLVGAGGHFCPVARLLNSADQIRLTTFAQTAAVERSDRRQKGPRWVPPPLVAAQEAEFPVDSQASYRVAADTPELYFRDDLQGYGWCFRKGEYLNVGLGLLDGARCSRAAREFVTFLKRLGRIPAAAEWRWRGHAYLLSQPRIRRIVGTGVVLLGDAAGLAYPQSGEGIRPAVESGLIAATTILRAAGVYSAERLRCYETQLAARFEMSAPHRPVAMPAFVRSTAARTLMSVPYFVRQVVIDRWFLRAAEPALTEC